MADQAQQTQQTPSQYEGTSNPPNGGAVLDISNPEANDATVPQTSAPNEPQQPQTGQTPTPGQPQPGQQGQQGQPGQNGKQPDLSKAQGLPITSASQLPQGPPPAVKKASVFHDVAEALAGGPRYTYNVDEYGNMQKTKVPVSNMHLGLAIAMEALTGAAEGLAHPGPGGPGKGAVAAMQDTEKRLTDADNQQKQQAQADFSRRAQVTETNMRLYTNARTVGKMDEDATDKYIAQYSDLVPKFIGPEASLSGYVRGVAKYSDFAKYNVTADSAIPYKRVPRIGTDGKQVTNDRGIPQWDIDYIILDPKFKTTGLLSDKDQETLKEMGEPWADNDMLGNVPLSGVMALNQKSRVGQWQLAKTQFSNFADTVNEAKDSGTSPISTPTKDVELPGRINALAENAAKSHGVDPKFIKGLIFGESSGNPNNVSATGATGLGQFTTATAKQYGLIDANGNDLRKDPVKNADATAHYFSDLLNKYKDPKLAFAAYYSGPGAVQDGKVVGTDEHSATDTQNYIQKMSKLVGLQAQKAEEGQGKFSIPKMGDWVKDHPTFASDVEKFNGALQGTDGNYGKALAHLTATGQGAAANNISAYLGGSDVIKQHDDYITTQAEIRKADVQTEALAQRAANKQKADTEAQEKKQAMLSTLESAKVPDNSLQMDPKEVIDNLNKQGVTLPPEAIRDAMAIARYEAPMNVASNKLWYKDQALNQQDLLDVVRQFNPSYNQDNYKDLHSFTTANSAPSKTFQAAAAVSNHLNMLLDLAHSVQTGTGQYPLINKLEGELDVHTGGSDYKRLQALTNAINEEMGKVLSGGFAPQKAEIEKVMNNMNESNSLEQIEALGKLYTGVMHGKISPYDEQYNQLSGSADKHLQNIPSSATKLFQHYGYETPWDKNGQKQQEQQQQVQSKPPAPGSIAGRDAKGNIVAWKVPDGKGGFTIQKVQPQ